MDTVRENMLKNKVTCEHCSVSFPINKLICFTNNNRDYFLLTCVVCKKNNYIPINDILGKPKDKQNKCDCGRNVEDGDMSCERFPACCDASFY